MSESKHTPGPWTVRGYKTKSGGIWIDGGFVRNRSCGTVAEVYPLTHQEANARLIAAAPDLLEALKALSASIFAPADDRSPELATAMQMTVNAISKATIPPPTREEGGRE